MAEKALRSPAKVELPAWGVAVFESHHAAGFRRAVIRHGGPEVFDLLGASSVFDGGSLPPSAGG